MEYYHLNWKEYIKNDIIENGSMGNFLKQYILDNNDLTNLDKTWRLFQEQTFELIRINEFPEKPSRYRSIFLFESEIDACEFKKKDKRENEFLYKIEILDSTKIIHRASMGLYERVPMGRPVLPALEEQARQYWMGMNNLDHKFRCELLVESKIKIL